MWSAGSVARAVSLLAWVTMIPGGAFAADPGPGAPADEVVFESATLRIVRSVGRDGMPRLVLTNLDEAGNRLAVEEPEDSLPPSPRPAPPPVAAPAQIGPAAESREIHVDAGEDNVVRVDDGNGTTIVININTPPAPPPAPAPAEVPVVAVPFVYTGSLAGPYRYPDRQPFLGYGTGVNSPSWFGGLGLNAGNGYGLSTGGRCDRGFDCMFPPAAPRR